MRIGYSTFAIALAAVAFVGGAESARRGWLGVLSPKTTLSSGHMTMRDYVIPPNVASIEINIYSAGGKGSDDTTPSKIESECVRIQGEKGRNGAGDAGPGLFCGGSVAILPGQPGRTKASDAKD